MKLNHKPPFYYNVITRAGIREPWSNRNERRELLRFSMVQRLGVLLLVDRSNLCSGWNVSDEDYLVVLRTKTLDL